MRLGGVKTRLALAAVVFVAMVAGFCSMLLNHLPNIFLAPEEDMDYAWFVPIFSLYVIYRDRKALYESLGAPSVPGTLAIIPFLLLGVLGVRGLQVRFELLAFIGLLIAVPWAMFGGNTAKRLLFPVGCLLFCMPMASYLSVLTVHLRLFASAVSSGALTLAGIDVVRQGNMIVMPGVLTGDTPFGIDIASPCSGLRSIFALIAISVGYGYFSLQSWPRRLALFVLSVPIAIFANVVRIMTICIVAKFATPAFAVGFYHDFSGFVVFAVAISLMVALSALISSIPYTVPSRDNPAACDRVICGTGSFVYSLIIALIVISTMVFQRMAPEPVAAEPPILEFVKLRDFETQISGPSEAETNLLRGANVAHCRYSAKSGFWFHVTTVISGVNKSSLHRPELCLPSQGFDMGASYRADAGGVEWTVIPLLPRGGAAAGANFAYTFVNQDGFRTAAHERRIMRDIWDRTVNGRIDRWAMVTVLIPSSDGSVLDAVLFALKGMVD